MNNTISKIEMMNLFLKRQGTVHNSENMKYIYNVLNKLL